jgi:hypothetical protein
VLPRSILSGQKEQISGQSPYVLPGCPVSARLTMLDIRYVGQAHYRWDSAGKWTEPLLSDYPYYLSIPDSTMWSLEQYYFVAHINREGRLQEVDALPHRGHTFRERGRTSRSFLSLRRSRMGNPMTLY